MIKVEYSSYFVRKFKKLEPHTQDEVVEKIDLFRNPRNHAQLKVHKLKGEMKGRWAFSINFRDRIVFHWSTDKQIAYMLDAGDHSIYE